MKKPVFNVLFSFVILFIGGSVFFLSPNWLILPITALAWLMFQVSQPVLQILQNRATASDVREFKRKLVSAVLMGLFLAFFDFAVENLGAQFGFWVSLKSNLFLLAVPIEIFLTCFFGGAALYLLISDFRWSIKKILANSMLWSIGGMVGEFYLNIVGFMRYGNGWTSIPYAVLSYIATWFVLHTFYQILTNKYSK